jgi:lipopolysaccharide/colanic/teichoic acid biosynthesis glycosyltransferase
MKIAVTGASGYLGSTVVPALVEAGHEVVPLGRGDYNDLAATFEGVDVVLHLAVLNNASDAPLDAFRSANVAFLAEVLDAAELAGVTRLVYPSTLHASDPSIQSHYANSKREAEALLAKKREIAISILRLPAVYDTQAFSGKFSILNHLPDVLRPISLQVLKALRPAVSKNVVALAITEEVMRYPEAKNTTRIVSDRQVGNYVYRFVSRSIDVVFSLVVIVLLWWVLVLAWLCVRLTSEGPGIFRQARVGKDGDVFTCYKLRTMQEGTQTLGTHEVPAAQVTPIGRFLRKTKLDELPQVWNLLRNEMSLVGPRPCLPSQTELVEARKSLGIFDVHGGISGWSQICGIDMSDPKRLARSDAEYLALRTIPFDCKIILKTAIGGGRGDNVAK